MYPTYRTSQRKVKVYKRKVFLQLSVSQGHLYHTEETKAGYLWVWAKGGDEREQYDRESGGEGGPIREGKREDVG